MNIIYATDDLYSKLVLVSLKSVFVHNTNADEINVYIVEDKIAEENKRLLKNLTKEYKRNIQFIPLPEEYAEIYSNISGRARASAVVYSYCYFQDILPQSIKKALMLEGDCIVLESLQEVYETDLDGSYFAAADDIQSKWLKKKLGMKPDSPYVNAGVILFNFDLMRMEHVSEKITSIIRQGNHEYFYEAQDELNVMAEGKIKILHPKYNCTTSLFLFDQYENMLRYRKPSTVCTKEAFIEAKEHPVILHFTKSRIIQPRPWVEECTHPYNRHYLAIKAGTELADEELWERKKQGVGRIFSYLYFRGAQRMVASILGPIHAILYPLFLYKFL